jgi:arylsulfatase A-like enzyme
MMLRRNVLRTAALAAPAVWVKAAPKIKRNVLFIAIDDMNDWVGCMKGYPGVQTPNLDRLASQGVLFQSAHCAAPLCNPSRVAIMMGRAPSSTGVYENTQPYSGSKPLKGAVSLNQQFKSAGYLTLGCGKIYHGTYGAHADKAGWDDYALPKGDGRMASPLPAAGGAARGNFDFGPTIGGDEEMHDFKTVDWVNGHLSRKQPQEMFLACGITKPHLPWFVPKKYFDLYPLDAIRLPIVKEDDLEDVPELGKKMALTNGDHARITKSEGWKKAVQAYLASITFSDAMVGRVLRALESGPHSANTDVVLWSDHGWHLGEKNHWRKFTLWERSTRNVLMMKVAGVTKPSGVCARTVSMLDIYPTLTELHQLPKAPALDGTSAVPLLKNPSMKWNRPAITSYGFQNHAVRMENWRYIRYKDGGEELYDRAKDPNEWMNLADKPEHAKQKTLLQSFLPKTNEPDVPHLKGLGE